MAVDGPSRPRFRSEFSEGQLKGVDRLYADFSRPPPGYLPYAQSIVPNQRGAASVPISNRATTTSSGVRAPTIGTQNAQSTTSKLGAVGGAGAMQIASIVTDNLDKTAQGAFNLVRTREDIQNLDDWAKTQYAGGVHAKLHADMRMQEATKQLEWVRNMSDLGSTLFGPLGRVAGHYIGEATKPESNLDYRTAFSPYGRVNPQNDVELRGHTSVMSDE